MMGIAALNFGKMLRSGRHAVYKLQKSAAIALNMQRTSLSMYENGLRLPNVRTLKKLCDAYQIDFEALLPLWAQAKLERGNDDE